MVASLVLNQMESHAYTRHESAGSGAGMVCQVFSKRNGATPEVKGHVDGAGFAARMAEAS